MKLLHAKIALISIIFTFLFSHNTNASHIAGGYISYECTGNPNEFLIRLTLYRDCDGVAAPTEPSTYADALIPGFPAGTPELNFSNSCGHSMPINGTCSGLFGGSEPCFKLTLVSSEEVSQLCDEAIPNSTCNGGNLPGYEEYIYEAIITLPPCEDWTLTYSLCCRNPATNVSNATGDDFVVRTVINTDTDNCHTTPTVTAAPQPFVCVGQDVVYNLGAFEPDGHNISYSLIEALADLNNTVNYNGGFTAQEPIPGLTIDPVTGIVQYTPTQVGNYIIVIRMTETDDDGNIMSITDYDFQANVIQCSNQAPSAGEGGLGNIEGEVTQDGENEISACTNEDICFELTFEDENEDDVLTIISNINFVFEDATISYDGTNPVTASICLNTGEVPGVKNITFLVQDDACPIVGQNNYTFTVNVLECLTCNISMNAAITECITTTDPPEYVVEGSLNVNNPPESGQIVLENCFGDQETYDAPFTDLNFSFNVPHTDEDCEFTATFVNASDDCEASTTRVVFLPEAQIITATGDANICIGDSAVVNTNGVEGYTWNDPSIVSGEYFFPEVGTNEYTASVTDENGCFSEQTVIVEVNPNPIVDAGIDQTLCEGENFTPNATGAASYEWSNGLENGVPFVPAEGEYTYTVVGVDANGCVGFDTVNVVVFESPDVSFIATPTSGTVPLVVQVTNTSQDGSDFFWDFGNGTSYFSDEQDLTETYNDAGVYVIILSSSNEFCQDTATAIIEVIFDPPSFDIPNVFTPNNDGTNDRFKLKDLLREEFIIDFEIVITNRWGNHMRTFNDPAFEWDGTTESGNRATEGVYFYKLNYSILNSADVIEHHGFVHLVRD